MVSTTITAATARYCYIDLDMNHHRRKLALTAAFVHATDSRYGFSSSDLRQLGGSEWKRILPLMLLDHEWSIRAAVIVSDSAAGGGGGDSTTDVDDSIHIRPPAAGNRIVVQLFWDVAPLACENFATLCGINSSSSSKSGGKDHKSPSPPIGASGKPMTYQNSAVHRVIPGFILQGGDFVFGNGSGGESIFGGKGGKFKDERAGLNLKHDAAGVLSMGNSGKNSNTSQFFITLAPAPQCDGKHVVFGRVVSGWEVLRSAEALGTADGAPTAAMDITDCGVFTPVQTPGAGYWYDQPDPDSFTGTTPVFMVRPRVAVVAPNAAVADKFGKAVGTQCSVVSVLLPPPEQSKTESESETDEAALVDRVGVLLENFAVDVVLVAPALKHLVPRVRLDPSSSWATDSTAEPIPASEVIMEAKPVEAMATIRTQSWLAKRTTSWQLDGM
jgi:cyclophilin family peptidyl-prolyl cis-trans isomerase